MRNFGLEDVGVEGVLSFREVRPKTPSFRILTRNLRHKRDQFFSEKVFGSPPE
jgi:hypothetical protein